MRLIDADALIKDMESVCNRSQFGRSTAKMCIKRAPTIEPVKRGEWVGYETGSYNGIDEYDEPKWIPKKYYRCSECRKGTVVQSNFCAGCGADMRTEDA